MRREKYKSAYYNINRILNISPSVPFYPSVATVSLCLDRDRMGIWNMGYGKWEQWAVTELEPLFYPTLSYHILIQCKFSEGSAWPQWTCIEDTGSCPWSCSSRSFQIELTSPRVKTSKLLPAFGKLVFGSKQRSLAQRITQFRRPRIRRVPS